MKCSTHRIVKIALVGLVTLGGCLGTTGCAVLSPATIITPYAASDGASAEIVDQGSGGGVKLRNFLVVGADKGSPGVLVGAIANEGTSPVTVVVTVLSDAAATTPAAQGTVVARAGALTQIGPGGTTLRIPQLPQAPGAVVSVQVQTPAGGAQFDVPVLLPFEQYASITPTPTATPTPTPTPAATPKPTPTASRRSAATSTPTTTP